MTEIQGLEKRHVTNEEYAAAWAAKRNRRVMGAAALKFGRNLDDNERESECLQALWDTLIGHDPAYGQLFTTSLYRFVKFRCINATKAKRAKKNTIIVSLGNVNPEDKPEHVPMDEDEVRCVRDALKLLPRTDREVIKAMYFECYTAEETGQLLKMSKERVRQRKMNATARLKELCLEMS